MCKINCNFVKQVFSFLVDLLLVKVFLHKLLKIMFEIKQSDMRD